MTRHPDILFSTEYIKNVLYFATVRKDKNLKSTSEVHYFSIDNELVYENYYSDFGPLNLGCVYKYCKILNDKLKQFLNKQTIVHYTSCEPRKKANAAFLLGCYGVLYLSLMPRDALRPLVLNGQSYRPFQDATQGDSPYTVSLMDCISSIKKAYQLDFFNFQDFNYEEYERLDKIQGGDLNWIVPGKFLAFIGPVDYSVSLYHPPEMYIDYFKANNIKIVIRLNRKMYDEHVFSQAGIEHYDLFFPDGSCPPKHILLKFLQIAEEADGAIAVHCKAGLGRTGSLIGSYLIKHYRMTSHEAISWMRICRPGTVIGHQQGWLEHMEAWLIKQGNIYRKRMFQDMEKLPRHEFGIYSISEKMSKQRPMLINKPSPQTPVQRQTRSEMSPPLKMTPALKVNENEQQTEQQTEEVVRADLEPQTINDDEPVITTTPSFSNVGRKAYLHNPESRATIQTETSSRRKSFFGKCWDGCYELHEDCFWRWAVCCAKFNCCKRNSSPCCELFDRVAVSKATNKDQYEWRMKSLKTTLNNNQKMATKGSISHRDSMEVIKPVSRRSSGAGEPRQTSAKSNARSSAISPVRNITRINNRESVNQDATRPQHVPTFRTSQGPVIKTLSDAKDFLIRSSIYGQQREKYLNQSITVTPQYTMRATNQPPVHTSSGSPSMTYNAENTPFTSVSRNLYPKPRRRLGLGRSPSPSPTPSPTRLTDHSRATNTLPIDRNLARDSKVALREELSRLKVLPPRDGSIGAASVGAASLGARRDAPPPKRAPSVHSDERPLATQGDMLNSIKFQRRFRDKLNADQISAIYNEKVSLAAKEKARLEDLSRANHLGSKQFNQQHSMAAKERRLEDGARINTPTFKLNSQDHGAPREFLVRERNQSSTSKFVGNSRQQRPSSPKGRQRTLDFY